MTVSSFPICLPVQTWKLSTQKTRMVGPRWCSRCSSIRPDLSDCWWQTIGSTRTSGTIRATHLSWQLWCWTMLDALSQSCRMLVLISMKGATIREVMRTWPGEHCESCLKQRSNLSLLFQLAWSVNFFSHQFVCHMLWFLLLFYGFCHYQSRDAQDSERAKEQCIREAGAPGPRWEQPPLQAGQGVGAGGQAHHHQGHQAHYQGCQAHHHQGVGRLLAGSGKPWEDSWRGCQVRGEVLYPGTQILTQIPRYLPTHLRFL